MPTVVVKKFPGFKLKIYYMVARAHHWSLERNKSGPHQIATVFNPYPTAFPYGNGMVLHFYQQQESSTTKTVHKVINKGLKTYI